MSRRPGRLERFLRLPEEPPSLPAEEPDQIERFCSDPGYLRYMIVTRWLPVTLAALALSTTVVLRILLGGVDPVAIWLLGGAGATLLVAGPVLHVAAVFRYRLTWFALGRRSLRVRRGLWKIVEATITYENVQNLEVRQGPLQRLFGISSLEIRTAGGSSRSQPADGNPALKVLLGVVQIALSFLPGGAAVGSYGGSGQQGKEEAPGRLDGLGDASAVRDRILRRVRLSRDAGLGDEPTRSAQRRITREHVAALRGIRDAMKALRTTP